MVTDVRLTPENCENFTTLTQIHVTNRLIGDMSREGDGFAIAWKVILKSVRGKLKRFRARFVPYNLANSSQKITRKSRASLSLLSVKQSQ